MTMAEYIKREATIKAIVDSRNRYYNSASNQYLVGRCDGLDIAAGLLRVAPAADVAPVVHGRWISWEEAGNFVPSLDRHECSVCHDAAQVLVNGFELLSDYCPNCGAKMDGGADHAAD